MEKYGALESHGQRIHTKRQWIIENLESEFLLQLDDDMYFFRRCLPKYRDWVRDKNGPSWRINELGKSLEKKLLYTADEKAVITGFNRFRRFMIEQDAAHGCIRSRMGNNYEEPDTDLEASGREMHAIAHKRSALLDNNIRFDQIEFREDFNVNLQLLRKGLSAVHVYDFACSPNPYGESGGCSEYRTETESDRAALRLALMHPGFVTPGLKTYKTTGTRMEVTVAWQQAYLKGKALGRVVTTKEPYRPKKPGVHAFFPYKAEVPLYSYFNGEKWSKLAFTKMKVDKKVPEPLFRNLPYRLAK